MFMCRALSRASSSVGRRALFLLSPSKHQQSLIILSNQFNSVVYGHPNQVSLFHHSAFNSSFFQRFGFSSASPEPNEKQQRGPQDDNGDVVSDQKDDSVFGGGKESSFGSESQSVKRVRKRITRTAFSDSDTESDDDVTKGESRKPDGKKDQLLKLKDKEIEQWKDKVLRSYAEMENVMERTKREAENSKKFAIQSFAKSLLDVADNLGRASSVVKDNFAKVDASNDTSGVVPILKTLLEGVEMTEKQLSEVFKKFGVEKFDPTNESFDPHRHYAVFQVPDDSKPPGTVAHVLKAGYRLYDRVIRPAEVGVTQEVTK